MTFIRLQTYLLDVDLLPVRPHFRLEAPCFVEGCTRSLAASTNVLCDIGSVSLELQMRVSVFSVWFENEL